MDATLDQKQWRRIATPYRKRWGVAVYAVDAAGRVLRGRPRCGTCREDACREARAMAVREALRWGEPSIEICPGQRLVWAVPLMHNEVVCGGILACTGERDFFVDGRPRFDIREACRDLRERVEAENLTNASALAYHRSQYREEQERAYAIHAFKNRRHDSIRELYHHEEPALFAAIRAGDREEARGILNRILVAMHCRAGESLDLVKSLFLELVVSMARTAVEAGAAPDMMLGANFARMTALSAVTSDEELAPWLAATLERMMDAIADHSRRHPGMALADAMAYMERHCGGRVSREEAARAAHLSPAYFSALMRKETGTTFTEMINRMRIDRAVRLLRQTRKPLAVVALEAGFQDQSYFTKVFRRYRHCTPRAFRMKSPHPAAAKPGIP